MTDPTSSSPPHAGSDENKNAGRNPLHHFLTRKLVLDVNHVVMGYELRLRDRVPVPVIPGADSYQQMQDELLLASVIDLDFTRALGDRLIFVSVAPSSLGSQLLDQLPPEKIVVATHAEDRLEELIEPWRRLARQGIPLALDDAPLVPELAPLLELSSYYRLDTSRYDAMTLAQRAALFDGKEFPQLVAMNVDTEEDYAACNQLPFKLFQGWHFAQFQPASQPQIDSSRLRVMELLNLVVNHAEFAEIETGFKCDAGLSYKLLRFINSPGVGLRQEISSIRHALELLGHDQLYRWLTLLLFTSGQADARCQALLRAALIRARFTEILGKGRLPPEQLGSLFIVGILSMLDALFNVPMQQALADLKLPEAVMSALTERTGPYAPYLNLALACENFDQDTIEQCAIEVDLDADTVNIAHVQAMIWSEGVNIG